jgi:hypothetical protein
MAAAKPFDPHSHDSMTAAILARLDEQDRTMERNHQENHTLMLDVKAEVSRTNGRVRWLEKAFWTISGGLVVLGTLGGWWAAMHPAH